VRKFLVGFDPKANGGMWVWWQDNEVMRDLRAKYPCVMVREATAEEAALMAEIHNVFYPRNEDERQKCVRIKEMIAGG